MIDILDAILAIDANAKCSVSNEDIDSIRWTSTPISKADIEAKINELQAEYDAKKYQRLRKAEYPSIEELVVALYDTDDKSAIEAKRAEVKAKYPKS